MASKYSQEKVAYNNKYKKDFYDNVEFSIPKGKKGIIKDLAAKSGKSINQIIVDALESQCGLDLS